MEVIDAIILGIVQGITEFLPISSTAHLILIEDLFNLSPVRFGLSFDVALHMGTAVAVLVYFWETWYRLILRSFGKGDSESQAIDRRILLSILLGTIPAGVFGLLFADPIENAFRNELVIAFALIFGSALFYLAEKMGKRTKGLDKMNLSNGFLIGCSQAIALIPGISRSGITISAGLFQNFDREAASRFAFLLSTPIILGAGLKKLLDITVLEPIPIDWGIFAIGSLTALITGFVTIVYFLRFMRTNTLTAFIWYRVILAFIIIAVLLSGKSF